MDIFDQQLNKLLQETYFGGSPYERATGIKRQMTEITGSQLKDIESDFDQDTSSSEFQQQQERKEGVIERAAQDVAQAFIDKLPELELRGATIRQMGKMLADAMFHASNTDIPDDHGVGPGGEGTVDAWSIPDFRKAMKRVGELTINKDPMSAERIRNVVLDAINHVKQKMNVGLKSVGEPYEDRDSPEFQKAIDLHRQAQAGARPSVTFEEITSNLDDADEDEDEEESEQDSEQHK